MEEKHKKITLQNVIFFEYTEKIENKGGIKKRLEESKDCKKLATKENIDIVSKQRLQNTKKKSVRVFLTDFFCC